MSAISSNKTEPVVSYVDPHHFEPNDTAWAQCPDGMWHRVRITKKEMKCETHKPRALHGSIDASFSGRHLVAHTQYHARWRPRGGNIEYLGVFAQIKRKLLPDTIETKKWLLEEVGLENVAEEDCDRLHRITVAPRGWQPGAAARRRAPF